MGIRTVYIQLSCSVYRTGRSSVSGEICFASGQQPALSESFKVRYEARVMRATRGHADGARRPQ